MMTPWQLFRWMIWNASEYFELPLGNLAPYAFKWMIGYKAERIK
jgi:hypothetical protein